MPEKIYEGEVPSKDELEWVKLGKEMSKKSIDNLIDEAKGLTTLSSSLLAVYTGALTLFKLNEDISWIGFIAMLFPIIAWLISIYYSTSINFNNMYSVYIDSPTEVMTISNSMVKEKHEKLETSRKLFIFALGLSAFILILMGTPLVQEKLTSQNVQFLVAQDSLSEFENMSLPFEGNTSLTIPIELIKLSDKGYVVKLPKGSIIEIDSEMVNGIIYE